MLERISEYNIAFICKEVLDEIQFSHESDGMHSDIYPATVGRSLSTFISVILLLLPQFLFHFLNFDS